MTDHRQNLNLGGRDFELTGLSKINVVLGKNGSGKSSLLKKIASEYESQDDKSTNYVTPERGGFLEYHGGMDQNIQRNEGEINQQKRQNQWGQYKQYTITQFRRLGILTLKEIQNEEEKRFDTRYNTKNNIDTINSLLINIELQEGNELGFEIYKKGTQQRVDSKAISSGESELISLAIECLTYAKTVDDDKTNLLLMDEPDVHLHPDLQVRFIRFLREVCEDRPLNVIIATHSTAILGGLVDYEHARFAVQENGIYNLDFKPISKAYQQVLPVFGAHPLSNLFNENPIFLVEGDDDERIFQQAVRTSEGHLNIHPCVAGSKDELRDYEEAAKELLNGIYDEPRAYSLRDRDEEDEHIEDDPPITCFKTSCRNAENLILTDEVLEKLDTNWEELRTKLDSWLEVRTDHEKYGQVQEFQAGGYNRKYAQLKEIRNILIGETPSDKPWEVAVGQAIGELAKGNLEKDFDEGKLCDFLGEKLVRELLEEEGTETTGEEATEEQG